MPFIVLIPSELMNKVFEKVRGLISAPVTPFNKDSSVNYEAVSTYCEALHRNGVAGAFVNGTTGEGVSCTVEERLKLAEKWVETAPSNFKIIVHIGHTSVYEAIKLAKHAQDIGAFGVASIAPFFFKPGSVAKLVEHLALEAAACPELPYYFYHIPSLSGVNFPVINVLKEADGKIPNFHGIKYTFENLADTLECVKFKDGKYDILFGRDEMFMAGYLTGMKGAVGSTYNLAPKIYLDIMKACDEGKIEEAKALQMKSIEIINELGANGAFFAALKASLEHLGIKVGEPRSPLPRLSEQQKTSLLNNLKSKGLLDYCLK